MYKPRKPPRFCMIWDDTDDVVLIVPPRCRTVLIVSIGWKTTVAAHAAAPPAMADRVKFVSLCIVLRIVLFLHFTFTVSPSTLERVVLA